MELLILLLIGFLILIVVLPFFAIAKANAAKRTVDDLLSRLSSVEKDLRTLQQPEGFATKPEGAAPATSPTVVAVPSPLSTALAPVREEPKESEPPPIPQELIEAKAPQPPTPARPPIDWEQFMGPKRFARIAQPARHLWPAACVK